jgi:branched-chain amino acid transport system ATP-binding protein
MLEVKNIHTFYGPVQALRDVSVEVGADEVISIIGANGAGKSTLMKSIMGIVRPKAGEITFNGTNLLSMKPQDIVRFGVVYVPEGREIFAKLTVKDNLRMGAFSRNYSKKELTDKYEEMYAIFPRLKERANQMADSLSGGEQQMLAVARGLMSDPKMIMFDEPSLGLAPVIVDELFDIIRRVNREKKMPVVLVEQNAFMALSVSDTCYVLENGALAMHGESKTLIHDERIKQAYLGG